MPNLKYIALSTYTSNTYIDLDIKSSNMQTANRCMYTHVRKRTHTHTHTHTHPLTHTKRHPWTVGLKKKFWKTERFSRKI